MENYGEYYLGRKDVLYATLVNYKNPYRVEDFSCIKKRKILDTSGKRIFVEIKTYKQFVKLRRKVRNKEGIDIGIKYAYRSEQEQLNLYRNFCFKYGIEYANKIVCPVGMSEHHTGLALDIEVRLNGVWVSNNENLSRVRPILEKVHPYLIEYGFILRYPNNYEYRTGMPYEPYEKLTDIIIYRYNN